MIKRIFSSLLFLLFTTIGLSQDQFTVTLKGQIVNGSNDTLKLIQNDGKNNEILTTIPLDKKGIFKQKITLTDKDYYLLQLDDNQSVNVVIEGGQKEPIEIFSDGKNMFHFTNFKNSEASQSLIEFLRVSNIYKQKLDSVNQYLQQNRGQEQQIKQDFQPIYQSFINERNQFMNAHSKSPALIGVLSTLDIENEFPVYEKTVKELNEAFGESPTIERIFKQYKANAKIIKSRQPIDIGSEAIDIVLPTPAGDTLRLSDYKGQYVLLDFWASWCGPCRRENPNVVKMYKKYKEKGFVVFSVSLDKNKESWEKAIQQDGLIWPTHVSDLKYWQSAPAQDYKVHSIPHSFLIDPEGKIIAANLRGESLESKLKEIFGE